MREPLGWSRHWGRGPLSQIQGGGDWPGGEGISPMTPGISVIMVTVY